MSLVPQSPPASAGDVRDVGSIPGREDLLEEAWQPTPVFLPGESRRQRSLARYRPWDCKEPETSERLSKAKHCCQHHGQRCCGRIISRQRNLALVKYICRTKPVSGMQSFRNVKDESFYQASLSLDSHLGEESPTCALYRNLMYRCVQM